MPTTTRFLGFTSGVQRLVWSGPQGTISAHLWGGGGGRGGNDANGVGGNGNGGGYAVTNFTIQDGDVLDVAVGGPGGNGITGGSGPGGSGGASYNLLLLNTRTASTSPPVSAVTNPAWGSFLNTYGVWEPGGVAANFSRSYVVNFPTSDSYTFTFSADNYGTVSIDGTPVLVLSGNSSINYQASFQATVFVTAGNHTVSINAVNTGGPGGAALLIGRTASFSGGTGGRAGPAGSSGGGGGGGGATVLFLNNTTLAVAGGGGGGGGAGRLSSAQSAPGTSGTTVSVFNGQNGQDHPGDGGGGGAGGGGSQGGNGGACGDGDNGGRAGHYGLSTAPGEDPTGTQPGGTSSSYYRSGIAVGATPTQPATGGYAAIVIETSGTNVHNGGSFQSVNQTYIKDAGIWKPVKGIWVKDGGVWREVAGSTPPVFNTVPDTIGVNGRPYS